MKEKVKELIALLNMEDGLPMILVHAYGHTSYSVIADTKIIKVLMELKEEINREETERQEKNRTPD